MLRSPVYADGCRRRSKAAQQLQLIMQNANNLLDEEPRRVYDLNGDSAADFILFEDGR